MVSLGGVNHFSGIHLTKDDRWIVVGDGLSSGSFITVWQRKAAFQYDVRNDDVVQSSIENAALSPHRGATQKIADLFERDSISFEGWAPEYGPYTFFVGFHAQMSGERPTGIFSDSVVGAGCTICRRTRFQDINGQVEAGSKLVDHLGTRPITGYPRESNSVSSLERPG